LGKHHNGLGAWGMLLVLLPGLGQYLWGQHGTSTSNLPAKLTNNSHNHALCGPGGGHIWGMALGELPCLMVVVVVGQMGGVGVG